MVECFWHYRSVCCLHFNAMATPKHFSFNPWKYPYSKWPDDNANIADTPSPNRRKTKQATASPNRTFRSEWLAQLAWLDYENDRMNCICTACKKANRKSKSWYTNDALWSNFGGHLTHYKPVLGVKWCTIKILNGNPDWYIFILLPDFT